MLKNSGILHSIKLPIVFICLMWIIKIFESILGISFSNFGILPREKSGLLGIIIAPFLHGSFTHLISNTFPFFLLTSALFYFHKKNSLKILIFTTLLTGILVWIFARFSFHIGASGLIYAFASFFFFNGIIYQNVKTITLSVIVAFFYGGLTAGILPTEESISWESHLFGAISGLISAFLFKDDSLTKKYDWEDEDISNLPPPEISYKKGYPYE